jgi:hypothetical protein
MPNKNPIFYIIPQKSPAGRAIFGAPAMRNSRELHLCSAKIARWSGYFWQKRTLGVQNLNKNALL